jgi:O-antigen ligase
MTIWLEGSYAEPAIQAAILVVAAAAVAVRGPARPKLVMVALTMVALTLVALWGPVQLGANLSVYPYETWTAALRWTTLIAIFFLAYEAFQNRGMRRRARTTLAVFGAVMAVLAIAQAYTSHGTYFWLFPSGQPEVFGPFQNKNNYAAFIELMLPLTLWQGLKPCAYRTVWLTMVGVMAASVVASGSRAGSALVLAEIPAVLAVAWLSQQFDRRQLRSLAVKTAVVLALSIAATGWETLVGRLVVLDTFLYRREMLQSTIAMAKDRPWAGFGLGTFSTVYPAYAVFDNGYFVNHAHNDWAEWTAEGGLPFLLLLGAIAAVSSFAAIRSGWGLGLVAIYLHGFVDFPMQRMGVTIWMFVVGAALAAECAQDHRRQDQPAGDTIGPRSTPIAERELDQGAVGKCFEA